MVKEFDLNSLARHDLIKLVDNQYALSFNGDDPTNPCTDMCNGIRFVHDNMTINIRNQLEDGTFRTSNGIMDINDLVRCGLLVCPHNSRIAERFSTSHMGARPMPNGVR